MAKHWNRPPPKLKHRKCFFMLISTCTLSFNAPPLMHPASGSIYLQMLRAPT